MKITQFSRRKFLPYVTLFALLTTSLSATAATDYFLTFDGIAGESAAKNHKGAIDMLSFDWGLSVVSVSGGGGGASSGRPVFSDFNWTQLNDKSYPTLVVDAATGEHIKTAVADFTTTLGGKEVTYFKMSFDDVLLSSVHIGGSSGSPPSLSGSFSYAKVTLDYWAYDPKGAIASHSTGTYDLAKGTGSVSAVAGVFAQGLAGPQAALVPEPESYAMLLAGLGLIGVIARRRLGV